MYVLAIFGEFSWGGPCVVAPTLTKYLGFIISIDRIKADLEKIVVINQWEPL